MIAVLSQAVVLLDSKARITTVREEEKSPFSLPAQMLCNPLHLAHKVVGHPFPLDSLLPTENNATTQFVSGRYHVIAQYSDTHFIVALLRDMSNSSDCEAGTALYQAPSELPVPSEN